MGLITSTQVDMPTLNRSYTGNHPFTCYMVVGNYCAHMKSESNLWLLIKVIRLVAAVIVIKPLIIDEPNA